MSDLKREHTPFEMDVWNVEDVGGVLIETGHRRLIMCTCRPAAEYPLPWGHQNNEKEMNMIDPIAVSNAAESDFFAANPREDAEPEWADLTPAEQREMDPERYEAENYEEPFVDHTDRAAEWSIEDAERG